MITASDMMTIVSGNRLSSADKIELSTGTSIVVVLPDSGPDNAIVCRVMQVH
jgi:hypothetical protein